MIHIRKSTPADLESLRNIFNTIRREEFPWETRIENDDFDTCTEGETVYVSEIDGEVVGFISVWEQDCFVHNLFVSKSARKNGVGLALLQYARTQHTEQPLTLKCVQDNGRAYQFYRNHGWTVLEVVNNVRIPYCRMQWSL